MLEQKLIVHLILFHQLRCLCYTQQAPFTQIYHSQRVMPRPFAEKTDIVLRFKSSANTDVVAIAAEGYLIKNDLQAA